MSQREPRYSMDEHARRGTELYEQTIRPLVESGNRGKIVAIDIQTGSYELGDTTRSASEKLLARLPDAEIWYERIGHPAVYHILRLTAIELPR
jgi:hypothetical protein